MTIYLLLRCESRDQPSLGPAVALRPPLLNSESGASSGFSEVDWLLLILGKKNESDVGRNSWLLNWVK